MTGYPGHKDEARLPGEADVPLLHAGPSGVEKQRIDDKAAEDTYKERQLNIAEKQVKLAKSNLDLTRWLATFTFLGVLAGGLQAYIAHKGVEAANDSAKAAESAAYQACLGAQISHAAFAESIRADQDAHDAAVAGTYQTMVATRSEAAYIDFQSTGLSFVPGQPISVDFHVKNEGKTAASDLVVKARIIFIFGKEVPQFNYPKGQTAYMETPRLGAGAEPKSLQNDPNVPLLLHNGIRMIGTPMDLGDLIARRKYILLFARATYTDSLGIHHWVDYCRTSLPANDITNDQQAPERCVRYNKEDRNNVVSQRPSTTVPTIKIAEITCLAPKEH